MLITIPQRYGQTDDLP